MVSAEVKTKPTSVKEVAISLESKEFSVATFDKSNRMIAFHGGENEGVRAIEAIRELGLHPDELRHVWDYLFLAESINAKNGVPTPHWELTFFFEPPVPEIEINSPEELRSVLSKHRPTAGTSDTVVSVPVRPGA